MIQEVFPELFPRFFGAFFSIFTPFAIAVFILYLVAPLDRLIIKAGVINKTLRSSIILSILLILTLLFIITTGDILYTQAVLFIENDWPAILSAIESLLVTNPGLEDAYLWAEGVLNFDSLSGIRLDVYNTFLQVTNIIITTVLTPVFLFFLLRDGNAIKNVIISVLPKPYQNDANKLASRADIVIKQYFNGRFISIIILALAFIIIFFIMGFGSRSILFGVLIGVLDLVPYVGPFIGMTLPVLYTLTDDTIMFGEFAPIAVVIISVVLQMLQNNILMPYVMGRETKMHPLLVLSSILFFGYLFGVIGIILAIPLTGTIKSTLEYYKDIKSKTKSNKVI
jgi:putative permease